MICPDLKDDVIHFLDVEGVHDLETAVADVQKQIEVTDRPSARVRGHEFDYEAFHQMPEVGPIIGLVVYCHRLDLGL